jgi:hypothetical protein
VRPTDEDQSGSRRPNLMSSTRRTASETNILAMLDRHESGGPGRRLVRRLRRMPAMAWYGTAGVLVIGLVGSLAWLARDSGAPSSVGGALTEAASGAPAVAASPPLNAPAAADAAANVVADADGGGDAGPADAPPPAGATIVDLAPAGSMPPAGTCRPHPAARWPARMAACATTQPAAQSAAQSAARSAACGRSIKDAPGRRRQAAGHRPCAGPGPP